MGIFDIFTGDSAKKAAEENKQLLQQNQTAGTTTLTNGQNSAIGALGQSSDLYGGLAGKYGKATSLGLDAIGVNGPEGNARATAAFQADPGYQYRVNQALDQTKRAAAASGMDIGGNTLAALSDRAGNMADQGYQTWLQNLQGYVSPELQATGGQAGAIAAKAPVYTGTAQNIANLGTNTTNGITNQNTQEANAEMQASKNLWGMGLAAAQLAAGIPPGGTSLLGSGGGGGSGSAMGTMQVGNQLFPKFG